ncbi:MAG: hypothetical protein H6719_26155 [Sandaracinaceae bacterium]|nr:hypothetical protein [Sandaracinaceae bacterium]
MRERTPQELEQLERRLAQLDIFLGEREPALRGLAERLGLEDPELVLTEPWRCLEAADALIAQEREATDREDPMWVLTRLGYLVGDSLAKRLGGDWFVNEVPQSRTFARYVVGRFAECGSATAVIDPFEVAHAVLGSPKGEGLAATVGKIESDLRAIPRPG